MGAESGQRLRPGRLLPLRSRDAEAEASGDQMPVVAEGGPVDLVDALAQRAQRPDGEDPPAAARLHTGGRDRPTGELADRDPGALADSRLAERELDRIEGPGR